jgi:hypothetical protein
MCKSQPLGRRSGFCVFGSAHLIRWAQLPSNHPEELVAQICWEPLSVPHRNIAIQAHEAFEKGLEAI